MASFGRYQLVQPLGRGGMAEVFLARLGDGAVAKLLAIKRLLPAYSQNKRLVHRLAAEARLTVWLTHPNIVQVFDFGKIGDSYFIAMEFVDGCDLRSLIQPTESIAIQLPMEVALDLGYRILDALRYAHGCTDAAGNPLGIIHRDVSPHNVLISRDGHPKLADFGVARVVSSDHHTQPGAVLGKFSYMAPEQARGESYDARVDVYAAGATLYQMLTGTKPFPERTLAQVMAGGWPDPPSSRRPSIERSLDELVMRALAPTPGERFASAAQMADALLEQLRVVGGPPRPHQVCALVEETLQQRRKLRRRANGDPRGVTLSDIVAGEDSLIGAEVTQVQQHFLSRILTNPEIVPPTAEDSVSLEPEVAAPPKALTPPEALTPELASEQTQPPLPPTAVWSVALAPSLAVAPRAVEDPAAQDHAAKAKAKKAPLLNPPWHELPRGMRLWITGGLGLSSALVIFALGLLVGRSTVEERSPVSCPALPRCTPLSAAPSPPDSGVTVALRTEPPPPASAPTSASAPALSAPASRPARPRVRGHRHPAARPTRPAPAGPRPATPADANPQAVREYLARAQRAYIGGNHVVARQQANRVLMLAPGNLAALQIHGASSCYLRDPAAARRVANRLPAPRRELLRTICARAGIGLP